MPDNVAKPSGKRSDLKGFGPGTRRPVGSRMGMPRARLHVPHGGAQKTPTQFGDDSHCQHKRFPSSCVKSAMSTRPAFLLRLWSTPKDDLSPSCCKHVVTLADPAQISRKKGSFGRDLSGRESDAVFSPGSLRPGKVGCSVVFASGLCLTSEAGEGSNSAGTFTISVQGGCTNVQGFF